MPSLKGTTPLLTATLWACSGCTTELPGERVGEYRVVMRLEENTCGPRALGLNDGWSYLAELRADGTRGFWRVPKTAPLEGRYERGSFMFRYAAALDFEAELGMAGCRVLREELLQGEVRLAQSVVDGGGGDAGVVGVPDGGHDLTGEHRIGFRADPTGSCAALRGPLGDLELLPCSARFRLEGDARKPRD